MQGRSALLAPLVAWFARLRFPTLFAVTAALFAIDLVVPDVVPMADELLLGLATALFASWRRTKQVQDENPREPGHG